jgi:hypothetical protein
VRDTARCGPCEAVLASTDALLNQSGVVVCRRCYYAEQTKLQAQRVEESQQQLGLYDAYAFGKRVIIGGLVLLVGGASLLGAIRSGEWQTAGWSALIVVVGVAVLVAAIDLVRHSKD